MAIASSDYQRLGQLVGVALHQGSSWQAIVRMIQEAAKKVKQTHCYSQKDFDIVCLIDIIGGPKLGKLMPSVGPIKDTEINHNISEFFGKLSPRPRHGHNLQLDELAINKGAYYNKSCNAIGGLCRDHSELLDLKIVDYNSVLHASEAIHGKHCVCHYGKEATVAAIVAFPKDHYGPLPILVSPTRKAANLIQWMLDCWCHHAAGEACFGPIRCFSTDGDATWRLACYSLFMKRDLDPSSEIYESLSQLSGLNLRVGYATLLQSPQGILVFDILVTCEILAQHFLCLGHLSTKEINDLLAQGDGQNVPHAMKLLCSVAMLQALNSTSSQYNPTNQKIHAALRVLAVLCESLVEPFFNCEMSLKQQLKCLTTYAHLSFLLYRNNGTSFMSNQLYGDTQATVKNVMFLVVKVQILDDTQPFYLIQDGDDRLEGSFGHVRTDDHDPNMGIQGLYEKLGSAADHSDIFEHHADWDRGNWRLGNGKLGADHMNPALWKGDVVSGGVSLQMEWIRGTGAVTVVLESLGRDVPDWTKLFYSGTVDLMKPMGDGKYPGVSQDPDHTTVNVPITEQCLAATAGDVAEAWSIDGLDTDTQHETLDADETDGLVFATDTLTAGDHPIDVPAITLQDLIPEPNEQENEQHDWLLFEGKKVHKASVIRCLFSSDKAKKSRECLLRVHGYTRKFSPKSSLNCDDLTGDHFLVGDLAAIIIRCDQVVSLAIMQVASIEQDLQRVTAIKEESLRLSTTSTFVSGQILEMCPAAMHNDAGDPLPDDVQQYLLWTGSYCRFSPWRGGKTPKGKTSRNTLVIRIPGHMVHPLNLRIEPIEYIPAPQWPPLQQHETWAVSQVALAEAVDALWEVTEMNQASGSIPKCSLASDGFPYKQSDGNIVFVAQTASVPLQNTTQKSNTIADDCVVCAVCEKRVKHKALRSHMGGHILCVQLGAQDNNVSMIDPCGFCGQSGHPVKLIKQKRTFQPQSSCPQAIAFSLGAVTNSSKASPSTNAPIHCQLCSVSSGDRAIFWKYNVHQHITSSHDASYESLPAGFAKEIEILQLEKEHLGIPLDLIDNSVQDDLNATAVASTSQNSLMKRRQQTLQGNTSSKRSKKV
ncbi:uncharacterized protein EDB91DRAFT_1082919 [Suillus paluster]|uniref:uncharacterized protein n=1 Tax=Suillus paluster TaxID=48578 RepID=UPI001B866A07|nr:uncharacterized protein EDB91DRAFT_1082919 [Suillus paluster]KAG1737818.1 hypothetical protein EDB91DRAFT_1082919 [Suillus paluster]